MSIFFLCNIGVQYYAVLYGENISRCTLAGQNKPRWILPGHFRRLLEAPYPPVSDFTRLFSPVERRQSGSVVFIDVRGAKNEDLTHWFKHVKHLWKCVPLPHAFSSQPSWCSSVSSFSLFVLLFSFVCVIRHTCNHLEKDFITTIFFNTPPRMRWCELLRDVD